jgi:hypothetical protein
MSERNMGAEPIDIVIKAKDGTTIPFRNQMGWDNFLANMLSNRAVIGLGLYLPLELVAIVYPYQQPAAGQTQASVTTDGNVIHLHPSPAPVSDPTPPPEKPAA